MRRQGRWALGTALAKETGGLDPALGLTSGSCAPGLGLEVGGGRGEVCEEVWSEGG